MYEIDFLVQNDRFSPHFLWKSGQGGLIMNDLSSLDSNINNLQRNKHFLFHGS